MSAAARNADAILRASRSGARRRCVAIVAAFALPWLCGLAALAWRSGWATWSLALCALALATTVALAWRAARTVDARWLARRLDARRADMEDSAALLFRNSGTPPATDTPLQRLQRERLRRRLETTPLADLRDRWPLRALATSCAIALALLAAVALWPAPRVAIEGAAPTVASGKPGAPALPRLLSTRLEIRPPAYTSLPARAQTALDAKVPEAATLRWTLRFAPQPTAATLAFHDGRRVALRREGDAWTGSLRLEKSALYRIELPTPLPKPQAALHRIDVVADAPPVLRALAPDRNLSLRAEGQRAWSLRFEADDDHGLAANARLEVVQTQGGGENITTRQRTLTIAGQGGRRHRRYAHVLDLGALGLSAGDDLIVRLVVSDNRSPRAQQTASPSFILRWPPEAAAESSGMEGLVRTTMPAYLRSQRQVIIDAEALLKDRPKLQSERFTKRSNELGGDQQALRLRYGLFLGEESEGAPAAPPNDLPTNDLPTNDAEDTRQAQAPASHDEHDAGAPPKPPAGFGEAGDIVAEYGHVHDQPEAATLLDPETKELLRAALGQMWQSELHLRQGDPAAALPFAYKALGFIKQVQQAERIYLARTGIEIPPIDEGRRLGGDRAGLASRRDVLAAATPPDQAPMAAWQALQETPDARAATPDYAALERWARSPEAHVADPLALFAAIDAARGDPGCAPCRARLRAALWPLLPEPPAGAAPRTRADAVGAAYLDALDDGGAR
ncbi:MAG TPA: hypothetical protein VM619_12850 [Luteimonas sp.]|nr:hypothetical protein [Luteimonas sp.]